MDQAHHDIPPAIPAATVVIFRNAPSGGAPKLLMLERAGTMRFAAGAAVFPGGRVDPADYTLAGRLMPDADPEEAAARIAAIRETLEETGLAIATTRPVSAAEAAEARAFLVEQTELSPVLERFGWTLDLERLTLFARWCPQIDPSYDTWFYLTDLGTGAVDIAVDATENTHLVWLSAQEVLDRARAGEMRLVFPTRRNLERLAQFGSFAEAQAHARATPVRQIVPQVVRQGEERWIEIPDGLGYPVLRESFKTALRQ